MKMIPEKNSDIIWRGIEGEAVLLNPVDGSYFGLNTVGRSFWEKVDGKKTMEEITSLLLQEYKVEFDVLSHDIKDFMDSLEDLRIILLK